MVSALLPTPPAVRREGGASGMPAVQTTHAHTRACTHTHSRVCAHTHWHKDMTIAIEADAESGREEVPLDK